MIDALQIGVIFSLGVACGWGSTIYLLTQGFFKDEDDDNARMV